MGNVVIDMSMSLDGYIAAPNDTPEQGLGEDGMRLHNWAFDDPSVFERVYGDLTENSRDPRTQRRRAEWRSIVPETPFKPTGPTSVNATGVPAATSTTSWVTSTSPGPA